MKRKILVADDHSLMRNGIIGIIESLGYSDVRPAESRAQIMDIVKLERREITHGVFDMKLSDGLVINALAAIKSINPEIRIAIISMNRPDVYQKPLFKFGVQHYITKNATDEEMRAFLCKFLNNDPYPRQRHVGDPSNPFAKLTEKEHEVLNLFLQGAGTKEIAGKLRDTQGTVSTLKRRIYEKTGTENEIQLLHLALIYDIS